MKKAVASELTKKTALYLPPAKLTTDNAAMIGAAGYICKKIKKTLVGRFEIFMTYLVFTDKR